MKKMTILCVLLLLTAGCVGKSPAVLETPSASPEAPIVNPTVSPDAPHSDAPTTVPPPLPTTTTTTPIATATPLPIPTHTVWDGTLETLTLADFPTQLLDRSTALEELPPLCLVAELPEQDTWLYGFHGPLKEQGLILRIGDQWQYFDIPYLLTRRLLPEISYGDFDGDLNLELSLLVYTASGTGVSIWDLWIIELDEDVWTANPFQQEDYLGILDSTIISTFDGESNTILLQMGERLLSIPSPTSNVGIFSGIIFGETVRYEVSGDGIRASFDGWLEASNVGPTTTYVVTVNADIIYTGSVFGLTNFTIQTMS